MCRYIVHSMWEDVEQRGKVMGVSSVGLILIHLSFNQCFKILLKPAMGFSGPPKISLFKYPEQHMYRTNAVSIGVSLMHVLQAINSILD